MCFDTPHSAKCERYSTNDLAFFKCSRYLGEIKRLDDVSLRRMRIMHQWSSHQMLPECASIVNLLFTNCEGLIKQTGLNQRLGWDAFHELCKKTGGSPHKKIPKNCALWFDGCNTCRINNGRIEMCTKRMCLRLEEPSCKVNIKPKIKQHTKKVVNASITKITIMMEQKIAMIQIVRSMVAVVM